MTFGPDPRKYPTAKAVVDAFKAKNYDPEGYTLYTYAAFQAFAKAAETAKSVKVEDVAKAMRANKVDTVIGTSASTPRATSPARPTCSSSGRTASTPRCKVQESGARSQGSGAPDTCLLISDP